MMFAPPAVLKATVFASLPACFRKKQVNEWSRVNFQNRDIDSFLEGPSFDREGKLYVVDIPFGRVFRVGQDASWDQVCHYDGWPNGLKIHRNGQLFVADHRLGILSIDPASGHIDPVLESAGSESFKGCNDLVFGPDGTLFFTDQGQTGLHDPTGRVFRLSPDNHLDMLLSNVPSPNGIVITPDQRQMFVAATRSNAVWRVPLVDGRPTKVGTFLQLSGGLAGPDGLALDCEGGLVVCQVGIGLLRFDAQGALTHFVPSPPGAIWTNIAFGGERNDMLHVVDSSQGLIHVVAMPAAGDPMYSHQEQA